mmetsp:Transcript_15724/g.51349  ORF Transcript_15724/g.51349 Transcript_15724/m.51349 type:complete len:224 (+) Transcript_15724:1991-2662(+)
MGQLATRSRKIYPMASLKPTGQTGRESRGATRPCRPSASRKRRSGRGRKAPQSSGPRRWSRPRRLWWRLRGRVPMLSPGTCRYDPRAASSSGRNGARHRDGPSWKWPTMWWSPAGVLHAAPPYSCLLPGRSPEHLAAPAPPTPSARRRSTSAHRLRAAAAARRCVSRPARASRRWVCSTGPCRTAAACPSCRPSRATASGGCLRRMGTCVRENRSHRGTATAG